MAIGKKNYRKLRQSFLAASVGSRESWAVILGPVRLVPFGHLLCLLTLRASLVGLAEPLLVLLEAFSCQTAPGSVAKLLCYRLAGLYHALVEARHSFSNSIFHTQQRVMHALGALAPDHRVQARNGVPRHVITAVLHKGLVTQPRSESTIPMLCK